MADIPNPEDTIAREGRLTPRGYRRWPAITAAKIHFDILYGQLNVALHNTLRDYNPIRQQYDGTAAEIDVALEAGIDALLNQAMNELWNRLRGVAETYHRQTRLDVFTRKAPSVDGFVLPRFYAALLSSIGPLRVQDSLRDVTIIYAPAQATRDNYGREQFTPIDTYACLRIISAMKAAGIPLASIVSRGSTGSFFTTCSVEFQDVDSFEVFGAFHHSHYTRSDIAMSLLFGHNAEDEHPFENLFTTIGFVNNEHVIDDFIEAAPLEAGILPDGPTRRIGGTFEINEFGLAPATNVPVDGRGQGIYVLGRGRDYYGACSLARDLSNFEITQILRHRILHAPGTEAPAPHAPHAPPAAAPAPREPPT